MSGKDELRGEIAAFLRYQVSVGESKPFGVLSSARGDRYERELITYKAPDGDDIPAFLFVPDGSGPFPGVVVHHQHNGERHLGKSEVAGLAGDPLQAFGPVLASQGFVVLAPDSICFEDRRRNLKGTIADDEGDFVQHYDEMCYRLLKGDLLMRKVLSDAAAGVSLLASHPLVDAIRIGVLGHSYGGNTALFEAALDERLAFAVSSGAVCSYRDKMEHGTGIEMAEVIPGFVERFDIDDVLACVAPRPMLVASADADKYSRDADVMVARATAAWGQGGSSPALEHARFSGKHPLTPERFERIVDWVRKAGQV
jgi:dienelactone hydrolase